MGSGGARLSETNMSSNMTKDIMRDILHSYPEIDNTEMDRIVSCMIKGFEHNGNSDGQVNLAEYIAAASGEEDLDIRKVALLFNRRRKSGWLEQIFDDAPARDSDL